MLADVVLYCGRYFLRVAGLYVAMETDPCRDMLTVSKVWDKEALDEAAKRINDAVKK